MLEAARRLLAEERLREQLHAERAGARRAAARWHSSPDAIAAMSDELALGALHAAGDLDRAVPADLAVSPAGTTQTTPPARA